MTLKSTCPINFYILSRVLNFYIHHFFEYTSKYIIILDMEAKYVTDVLIRFTQSDSVPDVIFYNVQFYSNKYNSQFDC